jgi:hypothetical protein
MKAKIGIKEKDTQISVAGTTTISVAEKGL